MEEKDKAYKENGAACYQVHRLLRTGGCRERKEEAKKMTEK